MVDIVFNKLGFPINGVGDVRMLMAFVIQRIEFEELCQPGILVLPTLHILDTDRAWACVFSSPTCVRKYV